MRFVKRYLTASRLTATLSVGSLFLTAAVGQPSSNSFLEKETPFLRSALVIGDAKKPNRVRRGVLVPIGHDHWACFDPDLLRWAAVWRSDDGQPPLTYDTMAAISYPDAKAKAERPPRLLGKILQHTPEVLGVTSGPGEAKDPRFNFLTDGNTPVGALPPAMGRFHGIALRGKIVVILYQFSDAMVEETFNADAQGTIRRALRISPHRQTLRLALGAQNFRTNSKGAKIHGELLEVVASTQPTDIILSTGPQNSWQVPAAQAASPVFPATLSVKNPDAKVIAPFAIRDFSMPKSARAIRPVDIAFYANGDAILSTLDGDIWRIAGIDDEKSTWQRIATGLYEPMAVTIDAKQRLFALGRDQITELIDRNGDHHIDIFRCASDAFAQSLHTRDFSTSMCIEKDDSFLIAKGGIDKEGGKTFVEHDRHRGAILRISSDGQKIESIAQGLRMPFVGLRNDGSVFASDQQGNEIPSTPIHRILDGKRNYGFSPTNFDKTPAITEPLLYYPYQSNRSAAGFATTSAKAFPDLGEQFLQISWNGRLFPVLAPAKGQAFSWMLPLQFDFPSLKGATHPKSGRLYVTGLGISGYIPTTPKTMGLASVEQSSSLATPISLEIENDAVVLSFHRALKSDESITPGTFRLFNIKRTKSYGSGHFRWDQKPGEQTLEAKSFTLSPDRRSMRIDYPLLRRSDVMDLTLQFANAQHSFALHLYSRPHHLPLASAQEMQKLGEQASRPLLAGDAAKGKIIFTQFACNGCHSLADEKLTGPPLNDVASRLKAAELRESILEPAAKIAAGYPPSMPSFKGVIPSQDLEHLIAYLLTLKN